MRLFYSLPLEAYSLLIRFSSLLLGTCGTPAMHRLELDFMCHYIGEHITYVA